ncbi:hypothetical protein ACOMHN_028304 [Nucella lapillus]
MTEKNHGFFPLARLLIVTSVVVTVWLTSPCHGCGGNPPHIVVVMVDDMGWQDASWNNPDVHTPYLSHLRNKGVSLDHHYMQPACTASRVAFLTGYYPYRLGFQRNEYAQFHRYRNHSLSTDITILPEYLRQQGYANHLVGKWQMGFCNWEYTPTRRGFDTFFGSYGGNSGHFNHTPKVGGYDLRDNLNVDWSAKGQYSTHLYTQRAQELVQEHHDTKDTRPLFLFLSYEAPHGPIEAPQHYIDEYCSHITDPDRRTRCGMMAALDEGVKNFTQTLKDLKYDDNLLMVFTSDNGAPGQYGGSNWPLRGKKRSAYEGGVRVPSFIYSKTLLRKTGVGYKGLLHVTDWLPTLLSVAGVDVDKRLPKDVDGFDQWNRIRRNQMSVRKYMVYDLDIAERYAAVRRKHWKLVEDSTETGCWGWYNPPNGTVTQLKKRVKDCPQYQLFNLKDDPTEQNNLIGTASKQAERMFNKLKDFLEQSKAQARDLPVVMNTTDSYPENWGGAWSPGWCDTAHGVGSNREDGGRLMDLFA